MNWKRVIAGLAPHADPLIAAMVSDYADTMFPKYGINTIRRQACILAHIAIETGSQKGYFTRTSENLNYTTAERIHQVWPKRFPTAASAAPFVRNPMALANKVYGDRMGNRPGTNDGWVFSGKGLWQLTGRDNMTRLAKFLSISPETAAAWLVSKEHALECVCALYHILRVKPYADSGDVAGQTKRINGGYNALTERKAVYRKAMQLLTAEAQLKRVALLSEPDAELPEVTIQTLREDGSRIIAGGDRVQRNLLNLFGSSIGVGTLLDNSKSILDQIQGAADTLSANANYIAWAHSHWKLVLLVVCGCIALYSVYGIWAGAHTVKVARTDDANTGANPTR